MPSPAVRNIILTGQRRFNPLTDLPNLVAYWRLEEASGTRVDATGRGNDLTDNNTVTQATGRVGQCASFAAATSEFLSKTDNTDLSGGDRDYTWFGWFKWASQATNQGLLGQWSATNNYSYLLYYNQTSDRLEFYVTSTGAIASINHVTATSFGAVPTDTWVFVAAWHDSVANTLNIQVNNGTVDSAAHSAGTFDSTAAIRLGWADGGAAGEAFDGLMDEVGRCNAVLTADQRTALYRYGGGV